MGQVRKDILNGWKEIGSYVGRDIRTVERWEKHRGLPVRRVPGAGRSTVYALIPELDEWLENSKSEADDTVLFPAIEDKPKQEDGVLAAMGFKPQPAPADSTRIWLSSIHRRFIARVLVAAGASLACLLVSPLVRSHANPLVKPVKYTFESSEISSVAPYRSQVAGVDDFYLRGTYLCEQRTPQSLERAQEAFSTAIAKDPNYAPAYAGLSNTYNLLREYSVMPEAEAYSKAKATAEEAIALDPRLPQAHASLAFVDFFWLWDAANAEREFRTAIALDPSSVVAHHWYGSMLTHEGRYAEAIEQLNLAQRLEPTSAAVLSTRALALGLSGHRGEAVDLLQDVISQTPGVSSPHAILATLSRIEPQDPALFLDEMRRTAELRRSDEMLQVAAAAEPAYKSGGESAMWMAILATEERLHPGDSDRTYLMAEAEAALGRNDAAFADLEQLARRREPALMGVVVDPTLAPLHGDRRYGQLVASMGLPPVLH
jgi:tetratricopeptide (TPR) repeat protein